MSLIREKMYVQNQNGLTLIEMLIAMILGLFVTAVIISVFTTNVRSSNENLKMIRLNQELRGAMSLITDELKRSGYTAQPSWTNTAGLFMSALNYNSTSSCLRYSYDVNADGTQDNSERMAFQFTSDLIRWGSGVASNTCNDGTWEAITDTDIVEISTMEINFSGSSNTLGPTSIDALYTSTGLSVYDVAVTIVGETELPHDTSGEPSVIRTYVENIRIANDDPK